MGVMEYQVKQTNSAQQDALRITLANKVQEPMDASGVILVFTMALAPTVIMTVEIMDPTPAIDFDSIQIIIKFNLSII